jgi:polar amino acid transport system substrate-binding protein
MPMQMRVGMHRSREAERYTGRVKRADVPVADVPRSPTRRALLGALCALPAAMLAPAAFGMLPRQLTLAYPPEVESALAPPFSAIELTLRLAETALQRAGIQPIREAYPWLRALERVRRGESDAFVTVPTPAREAYARFCRRPVLRDEPCVWFAKASPQADRLRRISSLADLSRFRGAMYRGSNWTSSVLGGLQPITLPSADAVIQMVAAGRADFFLDGRAVALSRLHGLDLLADFEAKPLAVDLPYAFHLGISRRRPDAEAIVGAVDEALADLDASGYLDAARQRFVERFTAR